MYEKIPGELKKLPNWVCWQAVKDETRGKIRKTPINPFTGGQAQSNNPQTWSDYETAVKASERFSGIGFMFGNCPYFGVDIDGIEREIYEYRNGNAGIVSEFVNALQSYSELSQSGKGIHIICRGRLPKQGRRRGNVEMYEDGRFFVMTGESFSEYTQISECTERIKSLHEKYIGGGREPSPRLELTPLPQSAEEVVALAKKAKNGDKFLALFNGDYSDYPSPSEADIAFCNMLAFWTRCDANLMDCIFRQSGLMREKWDRRQSGSTYGALTLQKAIASCTAVYEPHSQYSVVIGSSGSTDNACKESPRLYTFDDTGNAQRMVDLFGNELRYCYTDKRWYYYDGRKWCVDDSGASARMADQSVEAMKAEAKIYEQADADEGGDMSKQFQKHMKSSRSNKAKKAMLSEVMHRLPVLPNQLDKHKYAFNTPGGVLNMKTGELMQHNPAQFITKISSCDYTDNADCPMWISFLNDIFDNDDDLVRYIQKAVGYSMTGSIDEQCVFFLLGSGKNGKSTFLDIVRTLMGDYAANIQPESIMVRPASGNGINSDIARLKGTRFVTTVEPNDGMRLNEGLIKQLTGDDPVTARKLYGDEFEFKPEFKLWMATNHKPIIRGTDPGIWRRIHLIPFNVQIPDEKVDKQLKSKLLGEMPGIMHWAVEGCLKWQTEGLRMPKTVYNAVKEYRGEMDVISGFLESCCIQNDKSGEVKAGDLYAVYARWCDINNEYKMSSTKFGTEMKKRYSSVRKGTGIYFRGLSLIVDCRDLLNWIS